MIDRAFQYEYGSRAWAECKEQHFIHSEIEKLSYTLLVDRMGEDGTKCQYVYCPEHHVLEEILDMTPGALQSIYGCEFHGPIALDEMQKMDDERARAFVPFRWRVFQRTPESPMNIACDVAELVEDLKENNVLMHWRNFGVSVDFAKGKFVVTKMQQGSAEEWTTATDVEIPSVVVDAAIEALQESAALVLGKKPSVLSRMQGVEKVRAFVERPFDLHIVYLKNFFSRLLKKDFDEVFPADAKDNFSIFTKLLGIRAPKSLRKAYTFSPFSIVWYILFLQWEIQDINYMQRFFCLKDTIAGIPLEEFYLNTDLGRVETDYNGPMNSDQH